MTELAAVVQSTFFLVLFCIWFGVRDGVLPARRSVLLVGVLPALLHETILLLRIQFRSLLSVLTSRFLIQIRVRERSSGS